MAYYAIRLYVHGQLNLGHPPPLYQDPSSDHASRCLLRLDGAHLLLLQEPADAAGDALLQGPQRLVAQDALGLGDVVVARHGGHDGAVAGKRGGLADDAEEDLAAEAQGGAEAAGEGPDALGAGVVAGGAPDGAGKVPEVAGLVVCDEEGLAVDLFVVEGRDGGGGGGEEGVGGEEVGVGDVADVGEVEEVEVVAELDVGLAGAEGAQQAGEDLDVALAEDAGGADGGGEEVGGGLAVGVEDELLGGGLGGVSECAVAGGHGRGGRDGRGGRGGRGGGRGGYLGLRVVLVLLVPADHGPPLVGVEQVRLVVADDARRARVHEGLDAARTAGSDDGGGAVDVDPPEHVLCDGALAAGDGAGGVDDDVGPQLLEEGPQARGVGDVALAVLGARAAVLVAAQVDAGDGAGGPAARGERLGDDVVAEEAVAADDEHVAEVVAAGVGGHVGRRLARLTGLVGGEERSMPMSMSVDASRSGSLARVRCAPLANGCWQAPIAPSGALRCLYEVRRPGEALSHMDKHHVLYIACSVPTANSSWPAPSCQLLTPTSGRLGRQLPPVHPPRLHRSSSWIYVKHRCAFGPRLHCRCSAAPRPSPTFAMRPLPLRRTAESLGWRAGPQTSRSSFT